MSHYGRNRSALSNAVSQSSQTYSVPFAVDTWPPQFGHVEPSIMGVATIAPDKTFSGGVMAVTGRRLRPSVPTAAETHWVSYASVTGFGSTLLSWRLVGPGGFEPQSLRCAPFPDSNRPEYTRRSSRPFVAERVGPGGFEPPTSAL